CGVRDLYVEAPVLFGFVLLFAGLCLFALVRIVYCSIGSSIL
ncbi:hypothetical protein A2U01_0082010, partial [Trifolium medium]|nr:hypothetical protein [Trifolium medium]